MEFLEVPNRNGGRFIFWTPLDASDNICVIAYFALIERRLVIVHAVTKKAQKLKAKDIALAEARVADVRRRLTNESASPLRARTDQA